MRKRWLVVALALCAVLALALPTAASARVKPLFAAMSDRTVIPAIPTHDGGGSFTAVIDSEPTHAPRWFCYGIALKDLSPFIAVTYTAHVHVGAAGTIGPEVIDLNAPLTADPGASHGCVRLNRTLADAIALRPREYYVDIHSPPFPNGAARGQLFAVDPDLDPYPTVVP